MLTRRHACCSLSVLALISPSMMPANAEECAVATPTRQAALSPDDALQSLMDGNERFVGKRMRNCNLLAQVRATALGQAPIAAIVGCIDSRVPPELIFDQRIGDIFTARIAGNFIEPNILGSLEFATKLSGAKLVVVLGHSECGAIKGAIDKVQMGNLTSMLDHIRPAVDEVRDVPGEKSSSNKALVQAVADANVKVGLRRLIAESEVLKELVDSKELRIVGAMHDLATGRVTFNI
jgi:carbonic anhydrase